MFESKVALKMRLRLPLNWLTFMNLYFDIKHRVPFGRLLLWVAWDDVSGSSLTLLEESAPVHVDNLFYK